MEAAIERNDHRTEDDVERYRQLLCAEINRTMHPRELLIGGAAIAATASALALAFSDSDFGDFGWLIYPIYIGLSGLAGVAASRWFNNRWREEARRKYSGWMRK